MDNKLGPSDGWITVKDSLGMSPQFHKKQLNIDEYRTSVGKAQTLKKSF